MENGTRNHHWPQQDFCTLRIFDQERIMIPGRTLLCLWSARETHAALGGRSKAGLDWAEFPGVSPCCWGLNCHRVDVVPTCTFPQTRGAGEIWEPIRAAGNWERFTDEVPRCSIV